MVAGIKIGQEILNRAADLLEELMSPHRMRLVTDEYSNDFWR